jgi:hypothetical protein
MAIWMATVRTARRTRRRTMGHLWLCSMAGCNMLAAGSMRPSAAATAAPEPVSQARGRRWPFNSCALPEMEERPDKEGVRELEPE